MFYVTWITSFNVNIWKIHSPSDLTCILECPQKKDQQSSNKKQAFTKFLSDTSVSSKETQGFTSPEHSIIRETLQGQEQLRSENIPWTATNSVLTTEILR